MIYQAALIAAIAELIGLDTPFDIAQLRLQLGLPREVGMGLKPTPQQTALERFFNDQTIGPDQLIAGCIGVTTLTGLQLQFTHPDNSRFIIVRGQ
jgi:hypothetical protein